MSLDIFLVSQRRVCARATTVYHIPRNRYQKRRRLASYLRKKEKKMSTEEVPANYLDGHTHTLTRDRMTVKGLHFMLGLWHFRDQIANALRAFVRVPVPAHGRVGTIEIGQVIDACRGVVSRVVKTSEVVCGAGRNLDTVR
jgi:hypothetical protein